MNNYMAGAEPVESLRPETNKDASPSVLTVEGHSREELQLQIEERARAFELEREGALDQFKSVFEFGDVFLGMEGPETMLEGTTLRTLERYINMRDNLIGNVEFPSFSANLALDQYGYLQGSLNGIEMQLSVYQLGMEHILQTMGNIETAAAELLQVQGTALNVEYKEAFASRYINPEIGRMVETLDTMKVHVGRMQLALAELIEYKRQLDALPMNIDLENIDIAPNDEEEEEEPEE